MNLRWQNSFLVAVCLVMPICKAIAQTNGVGTAPQQAAFHPIPLLSYAAIDISGTATPLPVSGVALNDNNTAAFVLTGTGFASFLNYPVTDPPITQSTEFDSYTWQNGVLGAKIVTSGTEEIYPGPSENDWWFRKSPSIVSTSGTIYGDEIEFTFLGTDGAYIDEDQQGAIFPAIRRQVEI